MPIFRSSIPRSESIRIDAVLSRSRRTTRSPKAVGMVETRMSTLRSATLISIRPSWGSRFSAMLSFAMIFTRDTSGEWIFRGRLRMS